MARTKESAVQRELIDRLQAKWPDAYVRKIAQNMYSHGGIPDILVCLEGNFVAIEVKTDTGKLSKLQKRDIRLIEEAGGLAFICYGVKDIDYILSLMEPLCRTNS